MIKALERPVSIKPSTSIKGEDIIIQFSFNDTLPIFNIPELSFDSLLSRIERKNKEGVHSSKLQEIEGRVSISSLIPRGYFIYSCKYQRREKISNKGNLIEYNMVRFIIKPIDERSNLLLSDYFQAFLETVFMKKSWNVRGYLNNKSSNKEFYSFNFENYSHHPAERNLTVTNHQYSIQ